MVPGFITDIIAVLFLIPFFNIYLVYLILKYFKKKFQGNFHSYYYSSGETGGGFGSSADKEDFTEEHFDFLSLPFKKHKDDENQS